MTKIKKFIISILLFFLTSYGYTQNIGVHEKIIALSVNSIDTVYFYLTDGFAPDANAPYLNPPDFAHFSGDYRLIVQKTSGNASDSVACLIKPISYNGNFLLSIPAANLDTVWTFGSTNFTTSYVNVGNGSEYSHGITNAHYPTVCVAAIFKMGDLTGGIRTWKLSITKAK